jgi:MFS family permease
MSAPTTPTFRWRSVIVAALLPTLLFSIGEGAILPIIPVVASDLGSGLAMAGFIASMLLLGELLGDIPSGVVIGRIGERTAMIGASALGVLGAGLCLLAPNEAVLAVGVFVIGIAAAVFALARHAFLTSFVPLASRARALSTLGGTFRLGLFIGPFLTAGVIQLTGEAVNAFWALVAGSLAAAVTLVLLRDPETMFGTPRSRRAGDDEARREASGLFRTLWQRRRVLTTVGLGAATLAALRASRLVILPLWAVSIGLHESTASLIIGAAGAIDFALFYAGGWLMDRFGRLLVVVPSMLGLAAAHLVLAISHDLPGREIWFVGAAALLALANGMGSGVLMTIGADLADPRDPAPFLGAWRFTGDAGSAAAPLIISGMTALVSLAAAAGVIGLLGIAGAVLLRVTLPTHLPRVRRGEALEAETATEPGPAAP